MAPRVDLGEVLHGDGRVGLGRDDARMPEKPLHVPHVGAGPEQVRRESVAQRVGHHRAREPGLRGRSVHEQAYAVGPEPPTLVAAAGAAGPVQGRARERKDLLKFKIKQ